MNKEIDFEKISKEINKNLTLPKEKKQLLLNKFKINFISILLIIIYLVTLFFLEQNIQTSAYINILKSCSIVLSIFTLIMIEISYNKNKNSLIVITFELIVLTFYTIFLISAYSLFYGQFSKIITISSIVFTIYYITKIVLSGWMIRKNHFKNINDIKTIVAKDINK